VLQTEKIQLAVFTPFNISGEPNLAEEKLIRLDFCMSGKTEAEAKARCAEKAKLECSS
jgi:hypothetical protein